MSSTVSIVFLSSSLIFYIACSWSHQLFSFPSVFICFRSSFKLLRDREQNPFSVDHFATPVDSSTTGGISHLVNLSRLHFSRSSTFSCFDQSSLGVLPRATLVPLNVVVLGKFGPAPASVQRCLRSAEFSFLILVLEQLLRLFRLVMQSTIAFTNSTMVVRNCKPGFSYRLRRYVTAARDTEFLHASMGTRIPQTRI